jgi:outer membrane protein assembly factor BamA
MRCCLIFLAILCSLVVHAQPYRVTYIHDEKIPQGIKLKNSFSNRPEAENYIRQIPSLLLTKGWLAASVDSTRYDSTAADVWLYIGKQYRWGTLELPEAYQQIGNRRNSGKMQAGKIIRGDELEAYQQALLDYFAENGHPFASVGMDSVVISGDSLHGKIVVDEGASYKIDSIHLQGIRLKPNFIYPYLHIKKGMPYRQSVLDKVSGRLDELVFATPSQPWQLDMLGSGSVVNVYLQQKRSNIINVLLGVMPASTQTPDNKLLVTGEANILLRNAFANGEMLGINWQQIQYKSPRLDLFFQQPYLFGTSAGVDLAFGLLKKDSQYVNLHFRLGIPYEFSGTRQGKVFFQQLSTNVTYTDTNAVKASRQLPYLSNSSSSNLGLEYEWNSTDYRRNPRRGTEVFVSGMGGLKKIKKNSTVVDLKDPTEPSFSFDNLYDTVKLKTYQVRLVGRAAQYLPLGRLSVIKLGVQAGWYQSGNYYRNELFQIGGYRLLRGFDEESIFARSYAVATAEYRFITGRNAYFYAFSDGGYAQYKDQADQFGHGYIGAGLGLALETKNSVINISWAIGKRDDLPLDLRQSKIHLGFINYF